MDDRKRKLLKELENFFREDEDIDEASLFTAEELEAPMDMLRVLVTGYGPGLIDILAEYSFIPLPSESDEIWYFSSVFTLDMLKAVMKTKGISEPRGYDMELSSAVFKNNGVSSALLCERVNAGIIIRLMHFTGIGEPGDLLSCLRYLDGRLSAEDNSASLKLSFPADHNGNLKLIEYLTGNDLLIEVVNRGYAAVKRIGAKG